MREMKCGALGLLLVLCLALSACAPSAGGETGDDGTAISCAILITCQEAVESDLLSQGLRAALPEDGLLLAQETASLPEGTTALAFLEQAAADHGLVIDAERGATVYVKGIGGLYEADCGDMSGWMYQVNGQWAMVGAGDYVLQDGDQVQWVYCCDMNQAFE